MISKAGRRHAARPGRQSIWSTDVIAADTDARQPPVRLPLGFTSGVQAGLRWSNRQAERLERGGRLLLVALSVAYFAVTAILAAHKLMWHDELSTYYIARLPSMRDVWGALMAGDEQSPLFFYAMTRLAFDLFGANNASVRLPEMLGFWLMTVCLFTFAARRTSAFPALCAAALPLVTTAYWFAYEARPYGLLLGLGGLALVSWQSVTLDRRRVLSLVTLAISLAAAVSTHYYGVYIILPLALGEMLRTVTRHRLDMAVWAAFAVPAVPLSLHLPLIRAAASYSGAFWAAPQWSDISHFYDYLLYPAVVPVAAILVFAGIYVALLEGHAPTTDPEPTLASALPLQEVVVACGFIVLPFVIVTSAKVAAGAFTYRYAMPTVLGFAILGGFGAAVAFKRAPLMRLISLICLVGWFLVSNAREVFTADGPSFPVSRISIERPAEWLAAGGFRDLPFVVADPHTFTVLSHYGTPDLKSRLVYLADPDLALKHLGHNSVERGMLGLLKPWFGMKIVEFEPFIGDHPKVLLYGRFGGLNWILPELQARGMRFELLNREGDNLFLLVTRQDSGVRHDSSHGIGLSPRTP